MIKFRTVKGMRIELRKGQDAEFTSEIMIDGERVGCDAIQSKGCDKLFNELTNDKSGDKASYLKSFVKTS